MVSWLDLHSCILTKATFSSTVDFPPQALPLPCPVDKPHPSATPRRLKLICQQLTKVQPKADVFPTLFNEILLFTSQIFFPEILTQLLFNDVMVSFLNHSDILLPRTGQYVHLQTMPPSTTFY